MKQIIIDILKYLLWQVEHDKYTLAQIRSIYNAFIRNIEIEATVDDIAEHFGQSRENVKNVIYRHPIPKPKRKVHYSFFHFYKNIPKSWLRRNNSKEQEMEPQTKQAD